MELTKQLERRYGVPEERWRVVLDQTVREYQDELPSPDVGVTMGEAARLIGCHVQLIRQWVAAGKIRLLKAADGPGRPSAICKRDVLLIKPLYLSQRGRGYRPLADFAPV